MSNIIHIIINNKEIRLLNSNIILGIYLIKALKYMHKEMENALMILEMHNHYILINGVLL